MPMAATSFDNLARIGVQALIATVISGGFQTLSLIIYATREDNRIL